jgi:hypothetical protein
VFPTPESLASGSTAMPSKHPSSKKSPRPIRATPDSLDILSASVPPELLSLTAWVAWDGTIGSNKKLTKAPLDAKTGRHAKSNDPDTWSCFEDARSFALRDERAGGVGLALRGSGYWALDLDHVIDMKTGEVSREAMAFLAIISPTYVERSPSGDGLHVIFKGQRPNVLRATLVKNAFGDGRHLEVFGGNSSRFLTMTGQVWAEEHEIIEADEVTVQAIADAFEAVAQPRTGKGTTRPIATEAEDTARAERALQSVPADDYHTWIQVGMALHEHFGDSPGRDLWNTWSSRSEKYDDRESERHWRSFGKGSGATTIATLFWLADKHDPGWRIGLSDRWSSKPTRTSVSSVSPSPPPFSDSYASNRASVSSVSDPQAPFPEFRPLQPLPSELLDVPAFDPFLLPEAFRPWVEDIANRIQCPMDFPAVAAMVAYSSLVGRRVGVRPKQRDDWLVVPNLWGGPVGRPGVMKTPGIQEPMSFLRRIEASASENHERASKDYEAQLIVAKAHEKQVQASVQKALKNGGDALEIAREAVANAKEPPVRRRYVTNDATVEKLGELLRDNPTGILIFRDELTGLLKNLDKDGQEGSRAFYLESWNGTGAFTFDRIGRGTVEIPAACCSILGGIQPGPLSGYLNAAIRAGSGDDGLIQRFQLLVYPDVGRTWKNVDQLPESNAKQRAWNVFGAASRLDARSCGATVEADDQIPFLRFAPEAQDCFSEWRASLETAVRSGNEHPAIEAHLSKYRSLIPSLALLLHLADGRSGAITEQAVCQAIRWSRYLEPHARRVYGLALGSSLECRAIANHILKGDLEDGFSARDVYRKSWSHVSDQQSAERGLDQLIQLGWLAEEVNQTRGRAGIVYRINPEIRRRHPDGTDRTDRSPPTPHPWRSENPEHAPGGTDRTDGSTDKHHVQQEGSNA